MPLVPKKKVVDGSRPDEDGFNRVGFISHLKVAQAVRPRWDPTLRLDPIPPCGGIVVVVIFFGKRG